MPGATEVCLPLPAMHEMRARGKTLFMEGQVPAHLPETLPLYQGTAPAVPLCRENIVGLSAPEGILALKFGSQKKREPQLPPFP